MAADFIKEECADYDNITVAGHSKGGNLAQYCTITCSDQIDRCVSYDGQGMNTEYFQKYATEIAANRDKITCINCDGDYVNSLLFFLAKDVKFMLTEEGANPHAPWEFYCKNKDNVDENGKYVYFVEQTDGMKLLNALGDKLVAILGLLPDTQEEGIVEVVSAIVGLGFACVSGQLTWENVWDAYKTLVEASFKISNWGIVDIVSYLQDIYDTILDYANGENISWEKIQDSLEEYAALIGENDQSNMRHADFYVSCNGLQSSVQDMTDIEKKLDAIYSRLESIELSGALASDVGLNQALKVIREDVREEKRDVKECRETLSACIKCYQEAERRCAEQSLEV